MEVQLLEKVVDYIRLTAIVMDVVGGVACCLL